MKTEPNEPINGDAHCKNPLFNTFSYGLTKREYFAGIALQGLVVSYQVTDCEYINRITSLSVKIADKLIEELNKKK
jgi:archaellum biogenesis ATPase FlaH